MPTIRVPRPLRAHTAGHPQVVVVGHDVRSCLADLVRQYPALDDRLLDTDGELRRFVNVFVGDQDIRQREGMATEVADTDVLTLVPAVAGGEGAAVRRDRGHADTGPDGK